MLKNITRALILRYATSRRGFTAVVSAFAVVGIMLGVAALITVMCVMAGFRTELLDKILGMSGHATVYTQMYSNDEMVDVSAALQNVESIQNVAPYLQGQVMLLSTTGSQTAGAIVRGIDGNNLPPLLIETTEDAKLNLFASGAHVAIGQRMADALGVAEGGGLTLLSSQGAHTPFGFVPRIVQARVAFIFNTGSALYDQGLMLTNIPFAQQILRTQQNASGIELRLTNPESIHLHTAELYQKISEAVPDKPIQLQTWQTMNVAFFQALQTERVVMFIILSLIILVAAFNIITGQIMLVADKTPDIAILRTLGATRGKILRIFLFNGMLLGSMGTLLGFMLGLALVLNLQEITAVIETMTGTKLFSGDVYPVDAIPSRIVWPEILAVLAVSLGLTLLASILPAWRAAKMNPVEGLK